MASIRFPAYGIGNLERGFWICYCHRMFVGKKDYHRTSKVIPFERSLDFTVLQCEDEIKEPLSVYGCMVYERIGHIFVFASRDVIEQRLFWPPSI